MGNRTIACSCQFLLYFLLILQLHFPPKSILSIPPHTSQGHVLSPNPITYFYFLPMSLSTPLICTLTKREHIEETQKIQIVQKFHQTAMNGQSFTITPLFSSSLPPPQEIKTPPASSQLPFFRKPVSIQYLCKDSMLQNFC